MLVLFSPLQIFHPEPARKLNSHCLLMLLATFSVKGLHGPLTEADPDPLLYTHCMQSAEDLGAQVFSLDNFWDLAGSLVNRVSLSTSNRRRKSNIPRLYVEVASFTLNLLSLMSAIYKASGVIGGNISCPGEIPAQAGERLQSRVCE